MEHSFRKTLLFVVAFLPQAMALGCAPSRHLQAININAPERVTVDRRFDRRDILVHEPSDEGALIVEKDGVVLDLGGSSLKISDASQDPNQFIGRGIVVRNARNVTIRNAKVHGFKVAIYAEDAPGLTIENCDVSENYRGHLKSTPMLEHYDDWLHGHKNDDNEWLRYGAGIYLLRCDGANVIHNRARNGQNGLCVVSTNNAIVEHNDMSFMSGWGLAMWRSNFCRVIGNHFDFCVRGYSHGVYARGQDSAGILVYEQCSDNLFAHNSATHGGDGFFLYAGHETLMHTGEGGCNRNLVFGNDFSYAVVNGIEATFSDRNVFVNNTLLNCKRGIWAGYSRNSLIGFNNFAFCKDGISIEHGQNNIIKKNVFNTCEQGVHIWWDRDDHLFKYPFCKRNGDASQNETIRENEFRHCRVAVRAVGSQALSVERNRFEVCRQVVLATGSTTLQGFARNAVLGGTIANETNTPWRCVGNHLTESVQWVGDIEWQSPADDRSISWARNRCNVANNFEISRMLEDTGLPAVDTTLGSKPCRRQQCRKRHDDRFRKTLHGKKNIIITEWGPYDFGLDNRLQLARHFNLGDEAIVQIVAPHLPFGVCVVSGEIDVSPQTGVAPGLIKIRRAQDEPGMTPYKVRVSTTLNMSEFEGLLVHTNWDVAFYRWSKDMSPLDGDDAWRRIIAADPIHREIADKLGYNWSMRGPTQKISPDYFAAVATTTLALPRGRWRIRTISDDGIRVYVDNKRVINNWTWHIPTEDTAVFDSPGDDHAIRVEYFEITGLAQLQFFIESMKEPAT
ncbi:MAG: right-handed parallel beta-helix repeat-containing protein [Phycisphaerales bacterium]|nr:right-handed parallel beta-helix repeat-containing protein [Phycisphaerales bacterium]